MVGRVCGFGLVEVVLSAGRSESERGNYYSTARLVLKPKIIGLGGKHGSTSSPSLLYKKSYKTLYIITALPFL